MAFVEERRFSAALSELKSLGFGPRAPLALKDIKIGV
jgi:hypothetical protein